MKNLFKAFTLIALLAFSPAPFYGQANLRQPTVSNPTLLTVNWTAGTLNNGGKAVAIVAGTTGATASRTDCAAPAYATCGWIYANSSGTVANSTTLATAAASGNSIMAMYESNGTAITKLSFPLQNSGVGLAGLGVITSPTLVTPNIGAATGTSLDLTGSLDVGVTGTTAGTVVMQNATSGTITLQPTTGALGTVTATFPATTIVVPGTVTITCGTSTTCSAPSNVSATTKIFIGTSEALNGASPSVAAVSGFSPAFTSSTSYRCTGSINGAGAVTTVLAVTYTSASAVTFTGTNSATGLISYICIGN